MSAMPVCREDVIQGVRKATLSEDLTQVARVYMERNGEMTVIRHKGSE